jgi:EAL domain-containing protein (putative c-di-GMP-specific phosphodiesterase class I)
VNISGQSLGDADFSQFLESALREAGIPLNLLSFELTETAAVANIVRAEALMRRLREFGCAVALDDFGRGLSSLTYLRTLPVTHLKIDGKFRARCRHGRALAGNDERHRSACPRHEAQDRGRVRRKRRDRQSVRMLGVDYGQGFSIGRPIPLEKVLAALVTAKIRRSTSSTNVTDP